MAEGDAALRELLGTVLRWADLDVEVVGTPRLAVRWLADARGPNDVPSLVVLDPEWLEADGGVLRRALRARPAVGLVARGPAPGLRAVGARPLRVVSSPFSIWALLDAVEGVLDT